MDPAWLLCAQLALALAIALTCLALLVINVCLAARIRRHRPSRTRTALIGLALLATLALPAARIVLPSEDPYNGMGSPLASLMGAIFAGFFSLLLFTLPLWLVRLRDRDRVESL